MAENTHQASSQSDAAFRKTTYDYLRYSQKYLNKLKGKVADKAIVNRYGGQREEQWVCDPDTPTDQNAIMSELDDILKQICLYRDQLQGKKHCNFRDSGISMCSDRSSFANTDEERLSNAVQNAESHADIPSYLVQQGDVARNSRIRSQLNVTGDGTETTE